MLCQILFAVYYISHYDASYIIYIHYWFCELNIAYQILYIEYSILHSIFLVINVLFNHVLRIVYYLLVIKY